MNVESVVIEAFIKEWLILGERSQPHFRPWRFLQDDLVHYALDQVFDLDKVQRFVDQDVDKLQGRRREIYERFHRSNLRLLSRLYANTLYEFSKSGEKLDPQTLRNALEQLKLASACPVYPCIRT